MNSMQEVRVFRQLLCVKQVKPISIVIDLNTEIRLAFKLCISCTFKLSQRVELQKYIHTNRISSLVQSFSMRILLKTDSNKIEGSHSVLL